MALTETPGALGDSEIHLSVITTSTRPNPARKEPLDVMKERGLRSR